MMITSNALCNDRPVVIPSVLEYVSTWGSGYMCCDACRSIAYTRDSWASDYDYADYMEEMWGMDND
jgi:hypothetical protein